MAKPSTGKTRVGKSGGRYVMRRSKQTGKMYKVYVKSCKGSKKNKTNIQKRSVHRGTRGGQYCIVGGKKRYLKPHPLKSSRKSSKKASKKRSKKPSKK